MLNKILRLIKQDDYWHGVQAVGSYYSLEEIRGYYNDLRKKVVKNDSLAVDQFIPKVDVSGREFLHPVTVVQVGLGCIDLFLETNNNVYLSKAKACLDWMTENAVTDASGAFWQVPYSFKLFHMDTGFKSGLIQGQALSFIVRCIEFVDLEARDDVEALARDAYKNLVCEISKGGCRRDGTYELEEYPSDERNMVLNGYISAVWGVYDYGLYLGTPESKQTSATYLEHLITVLPQFDVGFWSRYCLKTFSLYYSNLASPYYHREHIAQLEVVLEMTQSEVVRKCIESFKRYQRSRLALATVYVCKGTTLVFQKLMGLR